MKTSRMTKAQLIEALNAANERITELEADLSAPGPGKTSRRKSRNTYNLWLHALPYGAAYSRIVYQDGVPVDIIFQDVNDSFVSLVGKEKAAGKKASELFPDVHKNAPQILETMFRVAIERTPEKFEIYSPNLQKWFLVWAYSPEKGEVVTIFDDITQKKQLEQALAEKNDLLEMVGEVAKIGGWEFDPRTSKGTWTDSVASIFGLEPGHALDPENAIDCFSGGSLTKIRNAVEAASQDAEPYDLELELTDKKGSLQIRPQHRHPLRGEWRNHKCPWRYAGHLGSQGIRTKASGEGAALPVSF